MTDLHALRMQLVDVLAWRSAHVTFDDAIEDFPPDLRGVVPKGLPHSAWHLLEHLRIAQRDILDFCRDPDYTAPAWPDDYWPGEATPPGEAAWNASVAAFRADLEAMQDLVADESTDLFAPLPHGDGQTILREAVLLADHNAYHVGQLVDVRRLVGCWR